MARDMRPRSVAAVVSGNSFFELYGAMKRVHQAEVTHVANEDVPTRTTHFAARSNTARR